MLERISPAEAPVGAASERPSEPELAVVVIALGAPPETVDAVKSVLAQDVPIELVVVNTGGGDVAALLRRNGIDARVVEREERLYIGAARNLGIAATRAPYVAFLAADCRAAPGWAAARLAKHLRGNPAVGSAIVNLQARNVFAWTAYLSLHARRAPGTPPNRAAVYSVSYHRAIFERYGTFREDLRTGEDSEFNARLGEECRPVWNPRVRTLNTYPTTFAALLRDHYQRGARAAQAEVEVRGACRPYDLRIFWVRLRMALRLSIKNARLDHKRLFVYAAFPLLPVAIAAYCLGGSRWLKANGVAATRRLAE